MLSLGLTFSAIAFGVLLFYALAAARFRAVLVHPSVRRAVNRTGAGCLVGAGLLTASLNRGA